MAGRHAQKSKSKAPIVIIIIASVLVLGAAGVAVFFFMNNGRTQAEEASATTVSSEATVITSAPTEKTEATTAKTEEKTEAEATVQTETGVPHEDSEIDVVVPTEESGEISFFDATFIPNGRVLDTYSGEPVTLREVFGEGFSDAVLTFNSDGTYRDTLEKSGDDAGQYVVQNGKIIATSVHDRNKQITVTEWNGDTPAEFYVDYGGFQVWFG